MKKIITLGILASLLFPLTPTFANYTLENCVDTTVLFEDYSSETENITSDYISDSNDYFITKYYFENEKKEIDNVITNILKKNNSTSSIQPLEGEPIIFSTKKHKYAFVINNDYNFQIVENGKIIQTIQKNGEKKSPYINLAYGPTKLFVLEKYKGSEGNDILSVSYNDKELIFENKSELEIIDDESFIVYNINSDVPAQIVKNGKVIKEFPNFGGFHLLNSKESKYLIKEKIASMYDYSGSDNIGNIKIFNFINDKGEKFGPFGHIPDSYFNMNILTDKNNWYASVQGVEDVNTLIKKFEKLRIELENTSYDNIKLLPTLEEIKSILSQKQYLLKNGKIVDSFENALLSHYGVVSDEIIITGTVDKKIATRTDWFMMTDEEKVRMIKSAKNYINKDFVLDSYYFGDVLKDKNQVIFHTFDEKKFSIKTCTIGNKNSNQATYKLSEKQKKAVQNFATKANKLSTVKKTKLKTQIQTAISKVKQDSPQYAILQELLKLIK